MQFFSNLYHMHIYVYIFYHLSFVNFLVAIAKWHVYSYIHTYLKQKLYNYITVPENCVALEVISSYVRNSEPCVLCE